MGEAVDLPYYLLLTRSITHAQRISAALEKNGISAPYFRPPISLSGRGCGYAVRIGENDLVISRSLLRPVGLEPVRIYYHGADGVFREIPAV